MDQFEISNKNDIYKGDFDTMVQFKGLEVFSKEQVSGLANGLKSLLKKGESNELSVEDKSSIDIVKADINSLTAWHVVGNDNCKTLVFTRKEQVTFEKSEKGEIIKGIYNDTELNQQLGRVGKEVDIKK